MQKLFCCILLILVAAAQVSQARIRFTDTSNKWTVYFEESGTAAVTFRYLIRYEWGRDTVMSGRVYKRLQSRATLNYVRGDSSLVEQLPQRDNRYLFREDTLQGKVWCYDLSYKSETLVYNAAWRVGDSIFFQVAAGNYLGGFIRKIDSVRIRNEWHRVFQFNERDDARGDDSYAIIEGVGCTSGPAAPAFVGRIGYSYSWTMYCFSNQGTIPAVSPAVPVTTYGKGPDFDNTKSCSYAAKLAVPVAGSNAAQVRVVPSPATQTAVLEIQPAMSEAQFLIYDAGGRLLLRQRVDGQARVPIGSVINVPGVYFYELQDLRSGRLQRGTFSTE